MDTPLTVQETSQEIVRERTTYRYFRLSVGLKGLLSALEIIGGVLVFLLPHDLILGFANILTQGELAEEPFDFIATHIATAAQELVSATTFVAFYLLSRGIIKLLLVVALLKNKLWAYPASLVVLALFILYQLYQMIVAFSGIVLLITVFDLIVVYFIWKEWQIVAEHHGQIVPLA